MKLTHEMSTHLRCDVLLGKAHRRSKFANVNQRLSSSEVTTREPEESRIPIMAEPSRRARVDQNARKGRGIPLMELGLLVRPIPTLMRHDERYRIE